MQCALFQSPLAWYTTVYHVALAFARFTCLHSSPSPLAAEHFIVPSSPPQLCYVKFYYLSQLPLSLHWCLQEQLEDLEDEETADTPAAAPADAGGSPAVAAKDADGLQEDKKVSYCGYD
jgi:hypothetical protein